MINKLKIAGYAYSVKKHELRGATGECSFRLHEILIKENMAEEETQSTILHEGLEAIDYHYGLKLRHDTIVLLETALFQFIKANKSFIKAILGEKT